MKRELKKMTAALLSGLLALSLSSAAFAEEETEPETVIEAETEAAEAETDAPAEAETDAPAEAETDAPAEAETDAPEEAEPAEPADPFAYIMYANADWSVQYWGSDPAGLTPANADITGSGEYTVGLTFDEPSAGIAFAAVGIDQGENAFPNYTIEISDIRVNGQSIEFAKGYTSSDDGVVTRMNVYNEWVTELPADARSFDGDIEGVAPIIVDKAAFESVESIEIDFTYHQYMLDRAYIMFANADWSAQYWGEDECPAGMGTQNAVVEGYGEYNVALNFTEPVSGLAFAGVGIAHGETTYPMATMDITSIKVNGEEIEFSQGYTTSDDGIVTRVNLYNEWVSEIPENARGFNPDEDEVSPIIVDPADFESVESIEVTFMLNAVCEEASLIFANADWSQQYWADGTIPEGMAIETSLVDGPGQYTVALGFDEPSEGLAFAAVVVNNGEKSFNGYFIDVTDVKVNGESIELGKGYTSSDDGVITRENIYNEWVTELPADARRKDGDLEGASPIIVDPAAFTAVERIEVTFNYIYGKPIVKDEAAPLTEEEAAELQAVDYNAYIGCQTENYIFRNAWNDTYGRDDAENEGFFQRLTGWDGDLAVDYGGTFEDAQLTAEGEYSVSLTTGEMGFGTDGYFRLLFVSTDLPSKLVNDGYVTIDNVRTKIGEAATQEYTDIDTSGEFVRIVIIDQYNRSEDPFGYTMPGADTTITITFNVTGLTE